jgi:low affinity Fe/Cu permease
MKKNKKVTAFEKFASAVTRAAGKPIATIFAMLLVVIWAATGPVFGYSDTWQLVINTSTTIITFIMVFIIQQTQNKDTLALQLKLNELLASSLDASNRLIDSEDLTEEELDQIKRFYIKLSKLAKKEGNLRASHSIDEAEDLHEEKQTARKKGTGRKTTK